MCQPNVTGGCSMVLSRGEKKVKWREKRELRGEREGGS